MCKENALMEIVYSAWKIYKMRKGWLLLSVAQGSVKVVYASGDCSNANVSSGL
jgi:hypothetical protein